MIKLGRTAHRILLILVIVFNIYVMGYGIINLYYSATVDLLKKMNILL